MQKQKCLCGKPLHYTDKELERRVDQLVSQLGPEVTVTTPKGSWKVPRHYVALHGIKAAELAATAQKYNLKKL